MLVKFRRSLRDNTPRLVIFFLFVLFMVAYLSPRIFVTIPAGHEGVLYRKFFGGTDVDHVYPEGLKLFYPWDILTPYNLREQILTVDMNAHTADGLNVKVTVTVRFQPRSRLLGTLHKEHGPDYIQSFLAPEVESSSRHVLGGSTPVELYSGARNLIEHEIRRHLTHELRQYDQLFSAYWPQAGPGMIYEGDVANNVDDDPNVRLILKHFYGLVAENSKLAESVRDSGYVHSFRQMLAQESAIEKAKVYFQRELDRLAEEISTAKRELGTNEVHEHPADRALEEAILDSLTAVSNDLARQEAQMLRELQAQIEGFEILQQAYDSSFMIIELKDVLVSDVVLPPNIKKAIESKLAQEQVAEEFDFRIERERKEAERKRIEARGIRDFQDMVAVGVEEGLLKWKAIEATLELARSPNAKMIIIGAGDGGLPVILGNQGWENSTPMPRDTLSVPAPAAPITSPSAE
jgi:prohibitin 1